MRFASLLALLLFSACSEDTSLPIGDLGEDASMPTTVSALDSLLDAGGTLSVNGRVAEHTEGERTLILDDGTGLVRVQLPESPPVLVGHRLYVRGTVLREDDGFVLDAAEWLYDSTAISVHSR